MGQFGFNSWFSQHRPTYLPVVGEEDTTQGPTSPSIINDSEKTLEGNVSPGEIMFQSQNNTNDGTCREQGEIYPASGTHASSLSPQSNERLCNGEVHHDETSPRQVNIHISPPRGRNSPIVDSPHHSPATHQYSPTHQQQRSATPTSPQRTSPISMVTVMSSSSSGTIPALLSVQTPPNHSEGTNGLDPEINQFIQSSVRFNVSITMPTNKHIHDITMEIQKALDARSCSIMYQKESDLKFALRKSTVQLEMEVCAGIQTNDLKIRKLAGDNVEYTNLCRELLAGMNL